MRLDFPATHRNREPILDELRRVLPASGKALEVASGSGQHVAFFAPALPGWTWQPTDIDESCLDSIAAWSAKLPNVLAPRQLDVTGEWPERGYDAVLAINLVHVAPWEATPALMRGAARALAPGGWLYLYGAMKIEGQHTAASNVTFDESLRARDPEWGVRDAGDLETAARAAGLRLVERVAMPSNNFSLWFRRGDAEQARS